VFIMIIHTFSFTRSESFFIEHRYSTLSCPRTKKTTVRLPPPLTYSNPAAPSRFLNCQTIQTLKSLHRTVHSDMVTRETLWFPAHEFRDTFNLLHYRNLQDEWAWTANGFSERDRNRCAERHQNPPPQTLS